MTAQPLPRCRTWGHAPAAALAAILAALGATPAHADGYAYRTIYVDGSVSTSPTGINERGEVVGSYQVESGPDLLVRPFTWKDGQFTTYPGGEPAAWSFDDVNDAGRVVSNVTHRDFATDAWTGNAAHRTLLAVPGAVGTQAYALNDLGVVVGAFEHDPDQYGILTTSAFAWSAKLGYRSFDMPASARSTVAWGVNDAGTVVGVWMDADEAWHGFVRTRDGATRSVDCPGSPYTQLMGINAGGDIVGICQDPRDFNLYGFVLRGDRFERVGPPEAANGSYPYRITDDGRIVGYYLDANYRGIGFLATPQ